ncbi:hypothetical protein OSB04_029312 [Centaurea solstitialis]|uniref:SWIM-type domain-containing protein n=1 Tax=Centaurea solstitialis TaxID=347529 RepID=A0AA38SVS0_9ASTR|nr:hypothetical protein OSB04_029312 [Centaurea solstitialis]
MLTPSQCRRAKMWALNVYEKSLVEHHGLLRAYGDELLRSNLGSTVKLGVTTNPDDQVYFDRFYVCLHGLKEGELLTAIGRDGNNHIFLVAWAVVNVENKDNWEWFIRLLGEDLDIPHGEGLTIMSDQHKDQTHHHHVRIRLILMERMERMRRISASWTHDICPTVITRIEAAMRSQRYWHVLPGGPMVFEVRQQEDAFIVNEVNKTCTCRMWQLSGIPCLHAVAAICFINKHPQDYVPDWFRKVKYQDTYASHILVVQGINQWPPNELNKPLPPKPRTMPGRPKKKRKRAIHEPTPHVGRVSKVGTIITCHNCGGEGHNKNGCKEAKNKGAVVEKPSKAKGKGTAKAKGINKGKGIDKGKGIAMDTDARKGLRPSQEGTKSDGAQTVASKQEVKGTEGITKKVRKQRVKGQMPTRRQTQARISKINMQKKVPGPGNTRDDAMLVD